MKFKRKDPITSDGTLQYSSSTIARQVPSSSTNLFNISQSELKASVESIKPKKFVISKKEIINRATPLFQKIKIPSKVK